MFNKVLFLYVCWAEWWVQELVVGGMIPSPFPFSPSLPPLSTFPAAKQLEGLGPTGGNLPLWAQAEPSHQVLFCAFWVEISLLVVTVCSTIFSKSTCKLSKLVTGGIFHGQKKLLYAGGDASPWSSIWICHWLGRLLTLFPVINHTHTHTPV